MATKGVKFTDEHRKHISESAKRSKLHRRFEKGHKDFGTIEGRRKQAQKMKGNKNNLGKHWKVKDTSKMQGLRYKHYPHQGFQKGCTGWLKGKHHTEEWKQMMREWNKTHDNPGRFKKGHIMSEDAKIKIGLATKGHKPYGGFSTRFKAGHKLLIKFKDTKIELKIEAELQKRNINYIKQVWLDNIATVDFLIPDKKIVIQCDGCYWHGCPIHFPNFIKNKLRDDYQNKKLEQKGYIIFRFWEHEINKSVKNCINQISI